MTSPGSFNTVRAVEDNVRTELQELERERTQLMAQLRVNSEQYVRALMHCAVADALEGHDA